MGKSVKEGIMPKAVVRDNAADPENSDPIRLTVGWSKELGQVQIGVENPLEGEWGDPARGWFMHILKREDMNYLIRSLRQARDDAFGKDE